MGKIPLNLVDEPGCLLVLAKLFELGTGRVPKWWPMRGGKPELVRKPRERLPYAGALAAGAAWSARWLPSCRRPSAARARDRG
jgi:hypothetical protein